MHIVSVDSVLEVYSWKYGWNEALYSIINSHVIKKDLIVILYYGKPIHLTRERTDLEGVTGKWQTDAPKAAQLDFLRNGLRTSI